MTAEATFRYVGTGPRGVGRCGATTRPAALAEQCYRRGWLWLRITDPADSREVGGIKLSDFPRRRVWWAETGHDR